MSSNLQTWIALNLSQRSFFWHWAIANRRIKRKQKQINKKKKPKQTAKLTKVVRRVNSVLMSQGMGLEKENNGGHIIL
jgi:ribosomal protein L44E